MVLAAVLSMWSTRAPDDGRSGMMECPSGVSGVARAPHAVKTLTVATYNAEWLFDGLNDPQSIRSTVEEGTVSVFYVIAWF